MAAQSQKQQLIDKANARIVISVSIAVFIVVFCLFAVRALISQGLYHNRVIGEKRDALSQLERNSASLSELEETYISFTTEPINVIGGNPEGDGPQDGNNATIVLDALPAEYDFPALSSSIEKLLVEGGYPIQSLNGEDQLGADGGGSGPSPISYTVGTETSLDGARTLLDTLERSIRPFYIQSLTLEGSNQTLSVTLQLETFYQPGTGLEVTEKVVK